MRTINVTQADTAPIAAQSMSIMRHELGEEGGVITLTAPNEISAVGVERLLGKYFSFKTYMYEEHNLLHCVTLILISIWIITSVCYLSGIIFYYTGLLEI